MLKVQPKVAKSKVLRFNVVSGYLRNETLQAVLIISLSLLIFLSTPLLNSVDSYYSPADLTQGYTFTQVTTGHSPSNIAINDVTVTFHPWFMYNRESIQAGKIPLWNPYNGNGSPYLANYTSIIFSPYSVPFYFLTFRQALIVTAFLRLFFIGFFTYLFLKQIKVRQFPALVGSIAFMYAGPNVFFLSGVNTAVTFVMPAGLYFSEKIFSQFEINWLLDAVKRPRYFWSLMGLGLTLGFGLLAGHAETFVFCFVVISIFILFRLISLWWHKKLPLPALGKLVLQLCVAGLLGAAIAAIQIIPFLEYFSHSSVAGGREQAGGAYGAPFELWPLLTFPHIIGDPISSTYRGTPGSLPFYYVMGFMLYIGGLVVFFAFLSLRYFFKDKYLRFFSLLVFFWGLYYYNVFGLGALAKFVPGLALVPVWRSQPIFLFSVSCCAALFLNRLYEVEPRKSNLKILLVKPLSDLEDRVVARLSTRWVAPAVVGGFGILFLAMMILGSTELIERYRNYLVTLAKAFQNYVPAHILQLGVSFVIGLILVLAFWLTRREWQRTVLCGLVLAMVFLQGGYMLKDFNPTTKDTFFYPITPAIQQLQQVVGNKTVIILGNDTIRPSINMQYHLKMPTIYDSLYIRYYNELGTRLFGSSWPDAISTVDEKALKLFGVEYYSHDYRGLFSFDTGLTLEQWLATQRYALDELVANTEIAQTFVALEDDLRTVVFNVNTFGRVNTCTIRVKLMQLPEDKLVQESDFPCQTLPTDNPLQFSFEPVANSKNKTYRLIVTSPDGRAGNAVSLWAKSDFNYPNGKLNFNNQPKSGGLEFDIFTGRTNNFQQVANIKGRLVYKYLNSPTSYYSVDNAIFADKDDKVMDLMLKPEFDPAQSVILTNTGNKETNLASVNWQAVGKALPAQVLKDEDISTVLKVERTQPGYVVLTKSFFPGWKAKVNGVEKPVLRANYAFSAVEVGAGESTIEYYYDPGSFKLGVAITTLALLAGLLLIIGYFWLNKRYKQ